MLMTQSEWWNSKRCSIATSAQSKASSIRTPRWDPYWSKDSRWKSKEAIFLFRSRLENLKKMENIAIGPQFVISSRSPSFGGMQNIEIIQDSSEGLEWKWTLKRRSKRPRNESLERLTISRTTLSSSGHFMNERFWMAWSNCSNVKSESLIAKILRQSIYIYMKLATTKI